MTSKLEKEMARRASAEKASAASARSTQEAREERARRQRRVFERKEFNRLFSRLTKLVDGKWSRYGHGWCFTYKGCEFYVAYEDWFSAKTPGDVDDYDTSGTSWVLKRGHNAGEREKYTLSTDDVPKQGLTESVLRGLKELSK